MVAASPLSVLAAPRREALVQALWAGERSAGELRRVLPDITFGAVSQHLARLRDAGLVQVRKDGRRRLYRVDREAFGPLAAALDQLWATQLVRLKALAEREARRRKETP